MRRVGIYSRVHKGVKIYGIRYMQVNGKEKKIQIGPKKRDAIIAQESKQKELYNSEFGIREKKTIGLSQLYNEFIKRKRNLADSSKKRYSAYFNSFFDFMNSNFPVACSNVDTIERYHIEEFADYLYKEAKRKKKPSTINGTIEFLNSLFIYAFDEEYSMKIPTRKVVKFKINDKKEKSYYSKEELEKLWQTVNPYWLDFLQFIYHTGLRKNELIHLTWDRVNLKSDPNTITIISSGEYQTKTGDKRVVPLNNEAKVIINNQVGKHKKYVFVGPNGEMVEKNAPYNAINYAGKKLGFKATVHMLRHSFASHLAMENESILRIGRLLGHKKSDTTQIYSHFSTSSLKSTVDKLAKKSDV